MSEVCGQEVDYDCNPLQLCTVTLPPLSLIHAVLLVVFSLFDLSVFNHQGRLAGVGGEDLPTIVVVAHYDSFGVAPVCSLLLLLFFSTNKPL